MRTEIKLALNQKGKTDEARDGIEMSLVLYFPESKYMEFAGARNPMYIVKDQELKTYQGDKMPIGIFLNEKEFNNQSISLTGDEMIYLFTDGIIDQMNEKGTRLMSRNLKKWILHCSNENAIDQKEFLQQKIKRWMKTSNNQEVEQIDDMLLMGFRIPN